MLNFNVVCKPNKILPRNISGMLNVVPDVFNTLHVNCK